MPSMPKSGVAALSSEKEELKGRQHRATSACSSSSSADTVEYNRLGDDEDGGGGGGCSSLGNGGATGLGYLSTCKPGSKKRKRTPSLFQEAKAEATALEEATASGSLVQMKIFVPTAKRNKRSRSRSGSKSRAKTPQGLTYAELSARIKQEVAERKGKSKAQANTESGSSCFNHSSSSSSSSSATSSSTGISATNSSTDRSCDARSKDTVGVRDGSSSSSTSLGERFEEVATFLAGLS